MAEGIEVRRGKRTVGYRASVFDARRNKHLKKTFPTLAAAKTWRQDQLRALRGGTYQAPTTTTVSEALHGLLAGMRSGAVLDRSGKPYKAATIRSYEQAVRAYVEPALGSLKLHVVGRQAVQRLVDELRADGLKASTVHNKLDPLRVLYRRLVHDGVVTIDPTDGLRLPAVRGRRERVASPAGAEALIEAVPEQDRALWATALYAGLRRGELRALRWTHIDFYAGVIRVQRGWDDVTGDQEVKTDAGRRTVPLAGLLRRELAAHKQRTARDGTDLVFGRSPTLPFTPSTVRRRAIDAWKDAGLEPLTPHEARHTFASYLIATGLNPKQVQTYVGHTDIRTTFSAYGHLLPGDVDTARVALDAFLDAGAVPKSVP